MGAAESRKKRTEEMRRFGDESALPKADPEREAFLAIPRVNCLGYYFILDMQFILSIIHLVILDFTPACF